MNKWVDKIKERMDLGTHAAGFLITAGILFLVSVYVVFTISGIKEAKDSISDALDFAVRYVNYYVGEKASPERKLVSDLFKDYTLDKGGMILILGGPESTGNVSGERDENDLLHSSNNEEQEWKVDFDLEERQFGMIEIKVNEKKWYGDTRQVDDYTICAFFPGSAVFHQRTVAIGNILVLYVFLFLLFLLIRSRTEEKNLNMMNRQYRIIDALGTVYTAIFMVDLDKDAIEVISGSDELKEDVKKQPSA